MVTTGPSFSQDMKTLTGKLAVSFPIFVVLERRICEMYCVASLFLTVFYIILTFFSTFGHEI